MDSEWEKLTGIYGGSVRMFYNFGVRLYAITDREVFIYDKGVWEDLKFQVYPAYMILDITVCRRVCKNRKNDADEIVETL